MSFKNRRWFAAPTLLAVLAVGACGGTDRQASTETTAVAPAATTASTAPAGTDAAEATTAPGATETTAATAGADTTAPAAEAGETFGDLTWPCGPATEPNADDGSVPGVTADSIAIATGDDAGYATSPGLNRQVTDAVNALAAKCNELGGIHGRQIKVNYYDAAITNVATAIQGACDGNNFFLVGEGWSFDSGQEEIRHGCGLPAVPSYTVSAAFAMSDDVYQGVPNPADETPSGTFAMIAELFPEEVQAVATLGGNYSATQETIDKVRAVSPEFGWNFVADRIEYDIFGQITDWTPIVKQIQDSGAKMVYWAGSCLPNLQKFAQTAKQNGFDGPIVTDANHYEAACAAANTDGALDNLYLRFAFVPFEEAADSKAVTDYEALIEANGGDISLLGMQASSSFLLWAQAAADCGATLTRECALENMSTVTSWTGGGLHAETNPGENHPPSCNTVMKLEGTGYVRVAPAEAATYECDPSWVSTVTGVPALEPLQLDENRKSHQFG